MCKIRQQGLALMNYTKGGNEPGYSTLEINHNVQYCLH